MKSSFTTLLVFTAVSANEIVENGFECDTSKNFMSGGPQYSQISLTDGCSNGVCDANPVYGNHNDVAQARRYCENQCNERNNNGHECEGFFFQKHNNGHEICGFYLGDMETGTRISHGHQAGAICQRSNIVVENGFICDTEVNFMRNGLQYSQISLTDGCSNGVCDANPRYGGPNNSTKARQYCERECDKKEQHGQQCEGFFYQKHNNGHEICGFYTGNMDGGIRYWGGHSAGAICQRAEYEFVSSGDCSPETLVANEAECQEAIENATGVANAHVYTWDTPSYAKGCFKFNYGHPGSAAAHAAPSYYIFNHNGGPGTSGHCTAEPGYAACICRDSDLV